MAIADLRLTTSRYTVPATYIDFVPTPQAGTPQGTPRYPCLVARGHRLARETSIPHIRARVYGEQLAFSTTAPYTAGLDHNAAPDQTLAQLYSSSGQPVDLDKWRFLTSLSGSGLYDRVQVDATSYDHTTTYFIEYQSIDRDVQDDLQFNDLREMLLVGDSGGQNQYIEYEDYRVVTGLTGSATDPDACTPGTANTHLTGTVSPIVKAGIGGGPPAGLGLVTFSAGNSYTGAYNRRYRLTSTNGVNKQFSLSITNLSGGNAQVPNVPANVADSIFELVGGGPTWVGVQVTDPALYIVAPLPNYVDDDGIRLTFDLNGGAFANDDYYEWTAYAPGKIEFCSAHDNTNQYSDVLDPVELGIFDANSTATQASGGVITVHSDTDYVGDFDRSYFIQCTANGGGPAPAARTATIYWNGYGELPYTNSAVVTVTEGGNASRLLLENGIYLTFNFGTAHATIDTTNTILTPAATTLSSAITLANMILTQFNAHDFDAGPVWHFAGPNAHQIVAVPATDLATLRTLALDIQTKYAAHLADLTQHVLADTIWSLDSDLTVSATSSLAEVIAFLNDVKTRYNRHRQANGFSGTAQSDTWRIDAKAARRNFTGKDDRNVTLTINTFVAATTFPVTYTSSTLEGGWGTVTIADYSDPWLDLPDSIRLMVRNLSTTESYTANNTFTFSTVNYDVVDWTLVSRSSETIAEDDIVLDTLGNVTGTPLDYYLDLQYTPEQVLRVKRADTGLAISYRWVTDTPYIAFTTDPATDVIVDYEHRGDEPDPGLSYYVTANRLRAVTDYDVAQGPFLSPDESRAFAYPATTDNHLWMGSEVAWNAAPFGFYMVQVRDLSGDGNFVTADYKRAIDATETTSAISDVIVLSPAATGASAWDNITAYAKNSCEKMNSPFEAKERLLWVGAPVGTAIGDESTPDTLVYYARRSLQCPPSGKAKGNIILLGNTTATRSFQLEDGSSTTVTLDGSYIAAHTAALVASFPNPTDTILHRACVAFDTVDTPNEKEALLLGTASITWLEALGTGTYWYAESVTVDTTQKSLNEISARTQAHFVVRYIRQRMNDAMIALVPPSPLAGVALLAGFLTQLLSALVSAQIIAPYGSELNPPVVRDVSSEDYQVLVDETDRSLYHFKFFFNGRYPIKRLFGLYSIDTKFWSASSAA